MYSKCRKPSVIIALQRKVIEEQEGIIAILKGALAAAGGETVPDYKPWMVNLTPQEQALLARSTATIRGRWASTSCWS